MLEEALREKLLNRFGSRSPKQQRRAADCNEDRGGGSGRWEMDASLDQVQLEQEEGIVFEEDD
eukprot:4625395-Pyramimonas_sp.AAC.1